MNIMNMVRTACRNYPERTALIDDEGSYSYRDFGHAVNRVANACLRDRYGSQTRVAMLSPNCNSAAIAMHGAMTAGMIWCNLNLRNSLEDNVDILSRGDCNMLFYHSIVADQVAVIKAKVPSLTLIICLDAPDSNGVSLDTWTEGCSLDAPDVRFSDDDIAFQGATGGTTGKPKLVLNNHHWFKNAALGFASVFQYETPPVNLTVAPISHAAGVVLGTHLTMGGTNILMGAPDLELILKHIETHRVTTLFLPPTVIYMLLAQPNVRDFDYSSLKYLIATSAPLSAEKIREATDVFGSVICQAWGQTEAGLPLTYISPQQIQEAIDDNSKAHRLLSCGQQTMITEDLQIMDEEGTILAPGEKGEIVVRAPQTMIKYMNDSEATQEAQAFGWHHTGDIGYRDEDGFFYICDRKRDMVVSGGFNIFPFEVEQVLFEHPAVQECAVIGVPDEKWGEAVKGVVQLRPGREFDEKEMLAFCKKKLGSMKAPKSIDVWETLPHNPAGKVLKKDIRLKYWDGQSRGVS